MSLLDIYTDVEKRLETDKPAIFRQLDEHIVWHEIIPDSFYAAFYKRYGRNRKYELESFMRALLLQRLFHYVEDSQLLNTLRFSREMRDFCGFSKVPDASKLTRFKQTFGENLHNIFEYLVDITEPICREMDEKLADMLVFDTTGIESYVAENNPKIQTKYARQANLIAKTDPNFKTAYAFGFAPAVAASNPAVKQQYINGHVCYAQKAAVVANGLGIVRHLELLDEDFKKKHPEMQIEKRTKFPEIDKEIGDSTSLKPGLNDFRNAHPSLKYSVFAGDAAFDSYDNYVFLIKDCRFSKAIIPFKIQPSISVDFNENGTPLCPNDKSPLTFHSFYSVKNRSPRMKFICPKTNWIRTERGISRRCFCENPCTDSLYGKCVYVYPEKNLRLYPGISRDSDEFAKFYNRRTAVERSINTLKDTLGISNRKTSNVLTTKSDLFLAGIVQLICVLLAHKLHNRKLARSPRKLIA